MTEQEMKDKACALTAEARVAIRDRRVALNSFHEALKAEDRIGALMFAVEEMLASERAVGAFMGIISLVLAKLEVANEWSELV